MKSFAGKNFKINDEIYRTEPPLYSRSKQRVLMSLDISDPNTKAKCEKPSDTDTGITWIKKFGKGRVFYCSLGHNHHLTWNPAVLQHILDGIQFAVGDLKLDDKFVKPLEIIPEKSVSGEINTVMLSAAKHPVNEDK
jgi:type 1 glutamine amidotransferase